MISRHYYHYFASAFVQETAVEFWSRFKVAEPGVVLVRSANLALTWWLLAEFCAELNICDNCQRRWPVPLHPPCLFLLCLHFSLCLASIFPCLPGLPCFGGKDRHGKSGEKLGPRCCWISFFCQCPSPSVPHQLVPRLQGHLNIWPLHHVFWGQWVASVYIRYHLQCLWQQGSCWENQTKCSD